MTVAPDSLGRLVHDAHGDAWAEQGRLRAAWGGRSATLPGVRVSSSGLPHPQWNNGHVHDAGQVDVEALRAWYRDAGVPWGVRVPAGTPWPHGRLLLRKRAMALRQAWLRGSTAAGAASIRVATPEDLDAVAGVDAEAFGEPTQLSRSWVEPELSSGCCRVVVAEVDGSVVGCATGTRSDGWAGPAVLVTGVAVVDRLRRRGIGAALTTALVDWAFDSGAFLVHLNPDDDPAARLYARLGFVEVDGFDVYVDG